MSGKCLIIVRFLKTWNLISEYTLVITQWAKTATLTICMSTSLFSSKSLFRLKDCWISFSSFPLLTIETIFLGLDLVFGTAYLSDFLAYKCHWLMLVSLKKGNPFFLFQEGTIVWAHSAIHLCPPKFLVTKELVCSKILHRKGSILLLRVSAYLQSRAK